MVRDRLHDSIYAQQRLFTTRTASRSRKRSPRNAATLARKQHILTRMGELQEEQLAIHQQATAQAAANAQVTIESLIAEAEAARAKAMDEKGGAAAALSALIAKAKLAGHWREKIDQHNTGTGTVSTVWNVSWDDEGEQSGGRGSNTGRASSSEPSTTGSSAGPSLSVTVAPARQLLR
jgi:hypothetical protein